MKTTAVQTVASRTIQTGIKSAAKFASPAFAAPEALLPEVAMELTTLDFAESNQGPDLLISVKWPAYAENAQRNPRSEGLSPRKRFGAAD